MFSYTNKSALNKGKLSKMENKSTDSSEEMLSHLGLCIGV